MEVADERPKSICGAASPCRARPIMALRGVRRRPAGRCIPCYSVCSAFAVCRLPRHGLSEWLRPISCHAHSVDVVLPDGHDRRVQATFQPFRESHACWPGHAWPYRSSCVRLLHLRAGKDPHASRFDRQVPFDWQLVSRSPHMGGHADRYRGGIGPGGKTSLILRESET